MKVSIHSLGHSVTTVLEASEFVPAIVTTIPHPQRTDRYSFVSTEDLIHKFENLGWRMTTAMQSGQGKFSRHIIRMVNDKYSKMDVNGDSVRPQIIIDNSHDGLTQAMIHMGIYKVISDSGMVIQIPEMKTTFGSRHVGLSAEDIEKMSVEIMETYKKVTPILSKMMTTKLTAGQQEEFVIKAIAAREPWRFLNEDGKILTRKVKQLNDLESILTPARKEDEGFELWKTFSVIQEKMIKGGYNRLSDKKKKSKTRAIAIPSRNVELNQTLWEMAHSYLPKAENKRASNGRFVKATA